MNALRASGIVVQVLVLALLGACAGGGGGGGGGGMPPPAPPPPVSPPPPPPPLAPIPPLPPPAAANSFPSTASTEFQTNWGADGLNAEVAWQYQNAHGEGVIIGVVDDGMVAPTDPNYAELAGRIDPRSASANSLPLSSSNTHGAELAAIMAGNFNGALTVGTAYQATILAVRADNGTGTFNTDHLAAALDYAVANGAKVVNFSLGSASPSGPAFQDAVQRATQAGVILVVSAGNCGTGGSGCPGVATQPNYPGFLAANSSVSNGLMIIAGGTNPDGSFNPVSNPAGTTNAANYYVTAPGWEIVVPDFGAQGPLAGFQRCYVTMATSGPCSTRMVVIQGTSYASPHVTAAVAILMSAFPGLTPAQVVEIILTSTDDTGAAGVDSVHGRGRLNLARAFAPAGTVSAPLAQGMSEFGPNATLGMVGYAFGDGLSDDAGEWKTVGFDRYGRTYAADYTNNWARVAGGPALAAEAPPLWRTMRDEGGWAMALAPVESVAPESYRLPLSREELEQPAVRIQGEIAPGLALTFSTHGARALGAAAAEPTGHLSFVNSDTSLQLTRRLSDHFSLSLLSEVGEARVGLMQERSARAGSAAQATFAFDRGALNATFGRITEEQGLLGFVWSDRLGETPRGEIRFGGLSGHIDLAPLWRARVSAETGVADLAQPGWIGVAEPLRTSAFGLELSYFGAPDVFGADGWGAFTLSVTQPMRVEDGVLSARLPTATNYGRQSLAYEMRAIDPTPSGRELRLGLGYAYHGGEALSAFAEVMHVIQPGHVADADDEAMLRLGLRLRR